MPTASSKWFVQGAEAFYLWRRSGEGRNGVWLSFDDFIRPRLMTFARRVLHRHPADVEDAVQDTFVRVMAYAGTAPDDPDVLRSWLYRVAGSVCRNLMRGPRARGASLDGVDVRDPSAGPETRMIRKEASKVVIDVLEKLPRLERFVVRMVHLRNRTIDTIARRLHQQTRQVRRVLARGCQAIKPGLVAAGLGPP